MRRVALGCLSILATACGTDDPGEEPPVDCADETRDDDFVIGLEKPGAQGALTFKLMGATPAPPVRGDNTWVIQISATADGAPVSGAEVSASPFMPDHGHAAGKAVIVEPATEAGQYEIAPLNFWMPGLWETTVEVTSGATADTVVFKFCVPA